MSTVASSGLPPIERSIVVSWSQAAAFRRFTEEFARWWPTSTHSIGGSRVSRLVLVSSGWEKLGAHAARARKGYGIGWGAILAVYAQRRTFAVVLFAALSHTLTAVLKVTGRLEREIDKAGGQIPPAGST